MISINNLYFFFRRIELRIRKDKERGIYFFSITHKPDTLSTKVCAKQEEFFLSWLYLKVEFVRVERSVMWMKRCRKVIISISLHKSFITPKLLYNVLSFFSCCHIEKLLWLLISIVKKKILWSWTFLLLRKINWNFMTYFWNICK